MKRYLLRSMRGRMAGILILFMTMLLLSSLYTIGFVTQTPMMKEKGNKLLGIAAFLDKTLGDQSYDDILRAANCLDGTREQKIAALNAALSSRTDEIASIYSGLGVGFYSSDLDAILTYGPSDVYGNNVGVSIQQDHPGRTVMAEKAPLVKDGTMVRGNIMNAMYPIERGGRMIGYTWANELTTDIEREYRELIGKIVLLLSAFFLVAVFFAVYLSRRAIRDVDKVVAGVKEMRYDLSKRIDVQNGEMGEVAQSINGMAEHIEKTAREHEELLIAEATNQAQREFLARMSHEIRTPMNGVLGMTRLAMKADTQQECLGYLGKIQSSATLLLGIINDILDFSKIEANKLELENRPFNIRETVSTLSELLHPRIDEKALNLSIDVDKSVPDMVVGDGLKFSQVLLNLMGNAVKFTTQGAISLRIRASFPGSDDVRLDCEVQDSGIGMSEEQIRALFKPFAQADSSTVRKFGGTGLGLFISKALIELMNGEITVESESEKGSTFKFHVILGRCEQQASCAQLSADKTHEIRYDGYHALLAEDNEINREIALAVLSEFGLQIDAVENGKAAVDAYKSKPYDLIFMDIRMPVMDGLEATRIIRSSEASRGHAHIPIIAMTANAMQEDREMSRQAGMDAHIAKPLDIEEIRQALGSVLDGESR